MKVRAVKPWFTDTVMDAGFFYPECRSERKLSALTLKHRAVRQYNSTGGENDVHRRERRDSRGE